MIRALSTRRNHGGYEKLGDDESGVGLLGGKLKRVTSVPASFYGPSMKPKQSEESSQVKKPTAKATGTVHPLLSFFDIPFQRKKNKKKKTATTAKPEFARYLEYLKEGGVWDSTSNTPVIYYR